MKASPSSAGDIAESPLSNQAIGSSPEPQNARVAVPAPVIDSEDVLRGQAAVVIAHRGAYYKLQATRQGKLILTK